MSTSVLRIVLHSSLTVLARCSLDHGECLQHLLTFKSTQTAKELASRNASQEDLGLKHFLEKLMR